MEPSADRLLAGRYRLLEPLGHGGMGRVWRADDLRLRRAVAIKILSQAHVDSPDARSRFEREALSAARLKSANIVRVLDFGIDEDTPYIVMELVEGTDLHQRLKGRRTLSIQETADILHQTSRGLRVAHKAGVVHRDLKPANLMIDQSEGEEVIKVMDFGVAKAMSAEREMDEGPSGPPTSPDMVLGTPQFMSPEHVRDTTDVDARSDVWSMGVIAYRCLTGRLPFNGSSVSAVLVSVAVDEPMLVSELRPDITPNIDLFFERVLAKDPRYRYQSVTEMVQAFFQICELSAPVDISRPTRSEQPSQSGEHTMPTPISLSAADWAGLRPSLSGSLNGAARSQAAPARRRMSIALVLSAIVAAAGVAFVMLRADPQQPSQLVVIPRARIVLPATATTSDAVPSAAPSGAQDVAPTSSASASASASAPRVPRPRGKSKSDPETDLYGERN